MYHLNFISSIPAEKITDLAEAALQANCVANIHKVYDQHLNFITLEDDMFILKHQNSDLMSYYGEFENFYKMHFYNYLNTNFSNQSSKHQ